MRPYLALVILSALMLSGCGNTAYFEPTPLSRPDNAMVYLYRPEATNPGLAKPYRTSYPEIMLDGISVGFLKYNRYLAIETSPGEREFLVTGLTRNARWEPRDMRYTVNVEAGESYFLRLKVEYDTDKMTLGSFKNQYIMSFSPVDGGDAIYEIRHTEKMD